MNTTSDTPRTDSASFHIKGVNGELVGPFVYQNFAKILERQLNEAQKRVKWLEDELKREEYNRNERYMDYIDELEGNQ